MSWPLSQDYNEAIQSPATNFADADLRRGEAAANALGLPAPYSGNFADVYQVRCPDGSRWAVKCFTREAAGLRERYQEISAHLKNARLPFSVDFAYLEKGIRVAGKWHPVLKMQWVEGLALNQFVAQYLDKPAMLEALLQLWARMGKYLRAARVGHCDLQHGNVLLVPGSTPGALALKLIDYDGMWAPALAGKKSGEVGHPNYQHPQRLREGTYSLEVDRFPLLLVATAMRALKADKSLWAKYDNGDNMLFKESDLAAPGRSELFEELSSLPDPGLVMLAAQVRAALKGPLESAALLEDAMPDAKGAPAWGKLPRPAAGPPSGVMKAKPVPVAAPVAAGRAVSTPAADALAFDADDPSPLTSSLRKKRPGEKKQDGPAARVPLAAWIGGGAALGVLALGGIIAAALVFGGKSNPPAPVPPDNRVAQKDAATPIPPVVRPDPGKEKDGATAPGNAPSGGPVAPPVPDPVVAPVAPPPAPPAPDGRRDRVGAYKLKTFDWNMNGSFRSLRLSGDGKVALAVGANGYVSQADVQSGVNVDGFLPPDFHAREAVPSPDGRQAILAGDDKAVHLWALPGRKELARMPGHAGAVNGVDVSADGKRVVSCGDDGAIFLWDLQANKEITHWKGSEKPISAVRFSPDGRAALSHGEDGKIHFWDVASGRETGTVVAFRPGAADRPVTAAFLPADAALVGFTNTCGHWDLKSGQCTSAFGGGPVCAVAASKDGRLTAFAVQGSPEFMVMDERKRGVFWPCRGVPPVAPGGLSFGPDGRLLLVGCVDGTVHSWSVNPSADDLPAPGPTGAGPSPDALSFETGWDKPVDPDGDCKFAPDETALTIQAPAKFHGQDPALGKPNAPRLQRDVTGDFTAQVVVGGDFRPANPSTNAKEISLVRAGLVVTDGDRTYAWLEHACALGAGQQPVSNVLWYVVRPDGGASAGSSPPVPLDGKPKHLRLERKGDRLLASYSADGVQWAELPTMEVKLPPRVKLGVTLATTSSAPFNPRFEDFRLTGGGAPAPPPVVAAERRQPPDAAEVAQALEEIKTTFKDSYDAVHSPKDAYALSGKLLAEAHRSKDNPARQYALFAEARDLAARGEDLPTSLEIIDETAAAYAINVNEAKAAALLAAGKTFSNRAAAKAYLDAAVPLLERARADDDYDLVAPLLPAVRQAYNDAQQPDLTKTASALVAQVERLQAEYQAVRPALVTLKEKPDDADANLAAGKFYALQKLDWDKGTPLLAKGSDAALAEAASKEAGPAATAADRTAAGDAWWKAGEKDPMFKSVLQRRALVWYDKALPDLTDKEEERVRTRVIELTKQFPDFPTAWADLDVSKVEVVGNCYLRLKPGQTVSTKQPSTGVVRVTAVARSGKPHLNFEVLQSSKEPKGKDAKEGLVVGWEVKDKSLSLHWLFKPPTGRPSVLTTSPPTAVADSAGWAKYACDLREGDTNLLVNDRQATDIGSKNDTARARTFQLTAIDPVVEVKSFTVETVARP